MSLDKWFSDNKYDEKRKKIDKLYSELSEEKVLDLKKKKIRELKSGKTKKDDSKSESNNFLNKIIEFKEWLNQRTYLKGDQEKIEIWIKNLNYIINLENSESTSVQIKNEKKLLTEQFRQIPPNFLDEKTRIAINKKLYGYTKTTSDSYYLKKLKILIEEKLKEATYYEILKSILELKK